MSGSSGFPATPLPCCQKRCRTGTSQNQKSRNPYCAVLSSKKQSRTPQQYTVIDHTGKDTYQ